MAATSELSDHEWNEAGERFRFAAMVTILLGLVGWVAWFYPFDDLVDRSGTPLGGDYVMLYVAGQTLASGQSASLYDDRQNQQRTAALFPTMDPLESWPFRYPPTVAACMVPLSKLPFTASFALFFAIQCSLLSAALMLFKRDFQCLRARPIWLWAIAGCPLVLEALMGGQSSLLALLAVLGFVHFFGKHQYVYAGIALALTLYKPNVLALFVLGCLIVKPRLWLGFLPTVVVGIAVAVGSCGWSGLIDYLRLGTQLATSAWSLETPFWKVHGLAPFMQMLLPEFGKLLCVVIGGALCLVIGLAWRAKPSAACGWMCLLLCVNSLFNPYVPSYDLVLLIAAIALGCESAYRGEWPGVGPRVFQGLAAVLFLGPHLSQAFSKAIGWQLFPLAVVVGLLITWAASRRRAELGFRLLRSEALPL